MKPYNKPAIISEEIFEKTALECTDYLYFAKDWEGCKDEYLGRGKESTSCAACFS